MYLRKPCSTHSVFHNFTSQSQVKSTLNIHWKDYWSSKTLATWCEELTHWKRPWCWERLRVGGKGGDRGWDDWMASPNEWTWVEQTLGDSEGRKPGVLQASCTVQELGLISWTVPNELLLHLLSVDSLFPLRRGLGIFTCGVCVPLKAALCSLIYATRAFQKLNHRVLREAERKICIKAH